MREEIDKIALYNHFTLEILSENLKAIFKKAESFDDYFLKS